MPPELTFALLWASASYFIGLYVGLSLHKVGEQDDA